MKFGKQLYAQQAIPLFRGQFVAYRTMKNLITDIVKVEKNTLDPEVYASQLWWFDSTQKTSLGSIPNERIQFIRLVENEINKTQLYYATQTKMLRHTLSEIFTRLDDEFEMETIMADIDAIAADLLILERFIWQAKQLILKITKKHDKITRYRVSSWMLVRLEKEDFWDAKLDELVIGISDAYHEARKYQDRIEGKNTGDKDAPGGAAGSFVRKNEKFFIKPEDVMLVKLLLVRQMPLDIFGRKMQAKQSATAKQTLTMDALAGLQDAAVINSVYLDNDIKQMYHERTGIEGPKGDIIRVRWYGSHPNPPPECWMERKTRQTVTESEYYAIDEAVKERFRIHERNVAAYMRGDFNVEKKLESQLRKKQIKEREVESIKRKANAIQQEILSKHLDSSLRTVVRRSAFQNGFDQTLRFSIDSNLHIINECLPKQNENSWARNMNLPLRLSEVVTLPYAILEIKTQAEPPSWVNELKTSGYIIPSDHFSKFLYGTCKLWPVKARFTPLWWERISELETIIPASPPIAQCPLLQNTSSIKLPHHPSFTLPLPATPRRKNSFNLNESPPSPPPLPHSKLSEGHTIVVTPDFERRKLDKEKSKELSALRLSAPPDSSSSSSSNGPKPETGPGGAAIIHTYSPFQKRRMDPRGSVQLDVISPLPTPEKTNELSFFFDVENQNKPVWRKAKDYVSGLFSGEPSNMSAKDKKQNAKQQAIEQRTAKTFFANERTLLAWMNTATFLSLAGLTMINTHTNVGRFAGMGLTLVTVGFALYALWKYMQRLYGLKGKTVSARLDDKLGPPILIISFCVVLLTLGIYFLINGDASYVKP